MTLYPTGTSSRPYCVAMADFKNNKHQDTATTTSETDNLVVFLRYGNGTFVTGVTYSTGRRSRPYILVISDLNNDKMSDIAVANLSDMNIIRILLQ